MIARLPTDLLLLPFPFLSLATGCGEGAHALAEAPQAHEHADELEPVGVTLFGERLLLYLEHPRLVRGEPARFLAHLSVRATGEPVRSGSVTLRIGTVEMRAEAPKRDGLFIPEGSLPGAGSFPGSLVVTSSASQETLDLGAVAVHASAQEAARAAELEAGEEPPGTVPFLMEQQWLVRLLLAEAGPRRLERRLTVPARVTVPEGASAVVSAPLGGRLLPPPEGAFPRTGDAVSPERPLALVEPPLAAPEAAQLRALDLEFDLEALRVLRAAGEAEAGLRLAERELERLRRLRAEGLATQPQVDRAEHDLAVARAAGEAAAGMKASLDALVARRDGRTATDRRLALTAPIAGTVVEVRRSPGESVAADEPVFRLLDASRLWIEGRVLEFDLPRVRAASGAVATFQALPGSSLALDPGPSGPWIGPEVDQASRTVPVRYELADPEGLLRVGLLAELGIVTDTVEASVSVPFEAVVMDQGFATAYVMLEGELFQRRVLELGLRDGDLVEVRAGLAPGEHVATRGAYLVRLAALSPASFGHGHAH